MRQRLPQEVYQEVFNWVLTVLAKEGLLKGKTLAVDATTLEANAALRSVVRRDTGQGYREYLEGLAQAEGIEAPTRQDLARLDKKRPRKGSNQDWKHPQDPEARITKMKDGRTHLAHKVEHAVDLDTQALVAIQVTGADVGDTASLSWTLIQSDLNLQAVSQDPRADKHLHGQPMSEVVTDKGYHSNDTTKRLKSAKIRGYLSEPDRGRRRWKDRAAQAAVYANRRRIRGTRGRALQRRRAECAEHSFAHTYESGGLRRTPAGPRQPLQAAEPSRQRLQSGLGHAEAHRLRDPEGSAGAGGGSWALQGVVASRSGPYGSRRRPLPHRVPGSKISHPWPLPHPDRPDGVQNGALSRGG